MLWVYGFMCPARWKLAGKKPGAPQGRPGEGRGEGEGPAYYVTEGGFFAKGDCKIRISFEFGKIAVFMK